MKLTTQCVLIFTLSYMLSGCEQQADRPSPGAEPFSVECEEVPIPTFTLGYDSNPSEQEVFALCNCIWENLGGAEKVIAKAISEGEEDLYPNLYRISFPARLGDIAIEKCGGMNNM